MSSCSLSLGTQLARIQSLQLVGGATDSIFPQVEALLVGEKNYFAAIKHVASRKNMDRYHSVMDFLFCELHQEYQLRCRRFYAGMGPMLKDIITPTQLFEYNHRMLAALDVAVKFLAEERRTSWGWYRKCVNDALKSA